MKNSEIGSKDILKDFNQPLNFHPLSDADEEQRLKTEKRFARVRIFENDFLESLTLVEYHTIFKVWIPVILILISIGNYQYHLSFKTNLFWIFFGVLVWSLAEYIIHRYLFHWSPKNTWGRRIVYQMHGNHHDDPFDPLRGVMPIAPALIYILILYWIFSLVIKVQFLKIFFAGFLIGYLCYDGIHFFTHHGKPKTFVGRYLRKIHMLHHVHEGYIYGISSPLWDMVFGTYLWKGQKPIKKVK